MRHIKHYMHPLPISLPNTKNPSPFSFDDLFDPETEIEPIMTNATQNTTDPILTSHPIPLLDSTFHTSKQQQWDTTPDHPTHLVG